MKTSDISDAMVVEACRDAHATRGADGFTLPL